VPKPSKRDCALATVVRRLREQRGQSQEQLGYRAGLTAGALARIELAQSAPAWATVLDIAHALELSLVDLAAAVEDERRRQNKRWAPALCDDPQ
jgi:transcriptional regulator with XRE-family HTH domain